MRYKGRIVRPSFHLGREKKLLENRGAKVIDMYETPIMHHLTNDQIAQLNPTPHIWKLGDKFYKLAFEHYGDASMWYVIAWFNKKPTDGNVVVGEVVYVPHPLEDIMAYYR